MRVLSLSRSHRTTGIVLGSLALFTLLSTIGVVPQTVATVSHEQDQRLSPQAIFTNPGPITINDQTIATPYPSSIPVFGLPLTIPNTAGSIKVTICNFSHTFPNDVGMVLVGPTAAALLIQDGAGENDNMVSVTYTLSDTDPSLLPDLTAWLAGSYKRTSYILGDFFPAPGPGVTYGNPGPIGGGAATFSSTFAGTNPNGIWKLYVVDFAVDDVGEIGCGWSLEFNIGQVVTGQHVVDFDGDGRTDAAVVRNTGGGPNGQITWFIQNSGGVPVATSQQWGIVSDFFVPQDYDGDGKTDIAVWRPGPPDNAYFFIFQSSTSTLRVDQFGQSGDDPTVVDDYDGDGKADPAVYRAGASPGDKSNWYYRGSTGPNSGLIIGTEWGQNGDFPAPGDYDGDGKNDFAVQRNFGGGQAIFYIKQTTGGNVSSIFGTPTDVIVPGDYDGDGKTDIATVRGSGGQILWFILNSSNGTISSYAFGASATDFPTQGDWDGDGKTDIATWRSNADPSMNFFRWRRSSDGVDAAVEWGQNGDYPVANYNTH